MKIEIDKELCIGCGACQAMNDEVFELVDGKSTVKKERVVGLDLNEAVNVARVCPVQAISVFDGEDRKLYPQ